MLKTSAFLAATIVALGFISQPAVAMGDGAITRCRIVEVLRKGQRESNKYIIRAYDRRGKIMETLKAFDGRPFEGYGEAQMGLFILIEEGTCPPDRRKRARHY